MEDDDPGAEIELSGAQMEMSDESPGTVWLMLSRLQLTFVHMKRGTAHCGENKSMRKRTYLSEAPNDHAYWQNARDIVGADMKGEDAM